MFCEHLSVQVWLNWVMEHDDDEVGLNEKPDDTRYIRRFNRNETQSTGSLSKLKIMDLIIKFNPLLKTAVWGMGTFVTSCGTLGDNTHVFYQPQEATGLLVNMYTLVQGLIFGSPVLLVGKS